MQVEHLEVTARGKYMSVLLVFYGFTGQLSLTFKIEPKGDVSRELIEDAIVDCFQMRKFNEIFLSVLSDDQIPMDWLSKKIGMVDAWVDGAS